MAHKTPFTKAVENAIERHGSRADCRELCQRLETEEKIVKKLIKRALDSEYYITVNDGEEDVVIKSRDYPKIIDAVFSTDEDYLSFYKAADADDRVGIVYLVYGNDGFDVISDYASSDLDAFEVWMTPVNEYADKFDK
jgi:hypothetical protein